MIDRDVLSIKIAVFKRHLSRIREKNRISFEQFASDKDIQDILLFNLGQAIQNCIDIASHIVSQEDRGVVGSYCELFYFLQDKGIIDAELADKMAGAVGFRNIITHEYARLDLRTAYDVVTNRYHDLERFVQNTLVHFGLTQEKGDG